MIRKAQMTTGNMCKEEESSIPVDSGWCPTTKKRAVVVQCNDDRRLRFVKEEGDRPAIYFKEDFRITSDDNCWVIQCNRNAEGKWKNTPWIFREAKEILDKLPEMPSRCKAYMEASIAEEL